MQNSATPLANQHPAAHGWRLVVLGGVVLLMGVGFWWLGDRLTLANLAQQENVFRGYQANHPVLVDGLAFLVYVAVTGLSLPGAAAMSLVLGWLLGFWQALILVSFASTTGATIAFLLSRYLFRELIQSRFGERLKSFNAALQREGAFYLMTLRLIPAVPFFVINVVMGLTPISVRTYWWVSQLGMLPGTIAYIYAGSSVPNLKTLSERGVRGILSPQLLAALIILGLLPWVARGIVKQFVANQKSRNSSTS